MVGEYWLLFTNAPDDGAEIGEVFERPKSYKFFDIVPLMGEFPDDVKIYFSEFNDAIKLYDFVENTETWLIVSSKVKEVFIGENVGGVEFLSVSIVDHHGDIVSDEYYILNILAQQNIINLEKSIYNKCPIDGNIEGFELLVTHLDEIDTSVSLFRPVGANGFYIVSDKLKISMEKAGLSGCKFVNAKNWDGVDLFMDIEWDPSS